MSTAIDRSEYLGNWTDPALELSFAHYTEKYLRTQHLTTLPYRSIEEVQEDLRDCLHAMGLWKRDAPDDATPTGHIAEHIEHDLIPEYLAEIGAALDLLW